LPMPAQRGRVAKRTNARYVSIAGEGDWVGT